GRATSASREAHHTTTARSSATVATPIKALIRETLSLTMSTQAIRWVWSVGFILSPVMAGTASMITAATFSLATVASTPTGITSAISIYVGRRMLMGLGYSSRLVTVKMPTPSWGMGAILLVVGPGMVLTHSV